jgi:HAMP domain-containing protein
MRRLLVVVIGLVAAIALPARAATPGDVAELLARQGYVVEDGAEPVDERELARVVSGARARGVVLLPVFLATDPPGGAIGFADEVLARVGAGTVVVLSPQEIGVSSAAYGDAEVGEALDVAAAQLEAGNAVDGLATFAAALAGGRVPVGREAARDDGGFGGVALVLGGLAVAGVLVFVSQARTRRRLSARREVSLGEARGEIGAQLSAMADGILELTDRVAVADNPEASTTFAEASATYAAVRDELAQADDERSLAALDARLDRARWQLEVARALVEGRTPPAPPEQRATCFFDPTHGAGTDDATLDTAAGRKHVRVCSYCAAKLRRGEHPEPRLIPVAGRPTPAPMAPPSHGGGGMGWLDAFTILLGGGRQPYDWGGYRTRHRRGWGGGWAGGSWGGGGGLSSRGRGGLSRGGGLSPRGRGGLSRGGGGGRGRGSLRRR